MTADDLPTPWRDLVAHNDGAQARAFLAGTLVGASDVNALFCHALEQNPLPVDVLDAFVDNQCLAPDWLRHAAKRSIDWKAAFRWREGHGGTQVLDRELNANFEAILKDYAARRSIFPGAEFIPQEDLILATLNRLPGLARAHYNHRPGVNRTMFELAIHPKASDWLARSGLEVLDFLYEGMSPLGNTRAFVGGTQAVDNWVALHPTYQQAWNRLVQEDRHMTRLQTEWFDQWLPQGQWKDSPLETWCREIHQGKRHSRKGNGPLDHPAMTPPAPLSGTQKLTAQQVADTYIREFTVRAGEAPYHLAMTANNRLRDLLLDGHKPYVWVARFCPVEPLGKALYFQEPWSLDKMATEDGARQIQALAAQDRRVELALGDNSPRQLCQWLIEQPAWRVWRASDGRTLLDLGVDRKVETGKAKIIPKPLLMKLARVAPDILLQPNAEGVPTLERLNVTGATKAAVRRQMLTAMTHATKRRKHAKTRAL